MTEPFAGRRALEGLRFHPGAASGRGAPGHVESWFLQAREPSGRRAVWVRHVVFARAPGAPDAPRVPPVAEAWAVAFDREAGHVAVKAVVPFERARFAARGLDVEVDGCALDRHRARGAVGSGGRAVAWDLAVGASRAAPVMHLPRPLYAAPFPPSKLVTSVSDGLAAGVVRVDRGEGAAEETWDVRGWSTVVGHNWGHGPPDLHAWGQASAWDVQDLVVEAVCGRVRLGRLPLLSPVLAGVFVRFRGRTYDLGAFEGFARNTAKVSMRRLEVEARSRDVTVRFEAFAETDELVGLHYADPAVIKTPRSVLASAVARARVELRLHDGSGRVVTATSRAASLEIGTREREHGVAMYV
jgi:hypothetical protein